MDNKLNSIDEFNIDMVKNIKERFDRYCGKFVRDNIRKVRKTLYELYDEYASSYHLLTVEQSDENGIESTSHVSKEKKKLWLYKTI
ncbi:hypothetical protein GQ457_13G016600 [Hibiscus cannabinus]